MEGRGMKPVVSFKFRFLQHNLWVFPCRHWEKQHISSLLSPELMIAIWRRTLAACLACNGNKEGFLGWLCGICRTSGAICFAIQVPERLHMQAVKAKTAALVPLWQSKYVTSTFSELFCHIGTSFVRNPSMWLLLQPAVTNKYVVITGKLAGRYD